MRHAAAFLFVAGLAACEAPPAAPVTPDGATASPVAPAASSSSATTSTLTTAEERGTIDGDREHFTGQATIAMLFTPNGPRTFSGAYVNFEPGARTAWHTHPAGQTLVVTEGSGWVQLEGEARRDLEPGDVVWTPPGVRHWHGATDAAAMTHMALQGAVDGTAVTWLEHVTDAQYLDPPRPKAR